MMRLYAPGGREVRRAVGFVGPEYLVVEHGTEEVAQGVKPEAGDPLRFRDPGDREREEMRCRR